MKNNKTINEDEQKRVSFNRFSKKGVSCLALAGIMALSPVVLSGCTNGVDGTKWYYGDRFDNEVGSIGDFFFDTDDSEIYVKTEQGWVLQSNLKGQTGSSGSQGAKGDQGETGENGTDGATWFSGKTVTGVKDNNVATVANSKVGDFYFNVETNDVYTCVEKGVWKWVANIKGTKGDTGAQGEKGIDADNIEMQISSDSEYIQWRYKTGADTTWKNLIAVSTLKGTTGDDGATPYIQDGYWYINGTSLGIKATGEDGKEIEIQKGTSAIEWRYVGEENWKTLVELSALTGAQGETGATGEKGKDGINGATWYSGTTTPAEAQGVNGDFYLDTTTWTVYKKVDNAWTSQGSIKGQDGTTPTVTINNDNYWVINGTVTAIKATGADGETPTIGDNGNWFIGTVDTNVKAQGEQGVQGEAGKSAYDLYKEANPNYTGTVSDWLNTLKGTNGENGKSVKIAVNNGEIQWRYTDDSNEWQTIIAQSDLKGTDGTSPHIDTATGNWFIGETNTGVKAAGTNGKEIELQATTDYIQWRYVGDESWTNLVPLTSLKGADGKDGATWISGTAVTTENVASVVVPNAKVGDFYLNTSTWDIFQKQDTAWTHIGNIKGAQGDTGAQGNGISSISLKSSNGLVDTYTITYTNGDTFEFTVTNGAKGDTGDKGQDGTTPVITINDDGYWCVNGVSTNVLAKGTDGDDGETPTISIDANGYWVINGETSQVKAEAINGTNGKDGATWLTGTTDPTATQGVDGDLYLNTTTCDVFKKQDGSWGTVLVNLKGSTGATGNGISSIEVDATNTDATKTVLKITFTNGTEKLIDIANGTNGSSGKDGVSITKVEKTGTSGLVDTYTITYSDKTTSTFTVTNGADGKDGATWLTGETDPTSETSGNVDDLYLNTTSGDIFKKTSTEWSKMGNIKGVQGTTGDKGQDGTNGATWLNGTEVTGTAESNTATVANAKVGDLYFNTSTCDVYTCTAENTWKWLANIKGTKGDTGATGAQGEKGDKGDQGTSLRFGTTVPSSSLGNDGDMYINTTNWYVYAKENGAWNYRGCIKGEKGDKGNDGASTTDALVYTGFDGSVWQGANKTSIKAQQTETVSDDIRERTLSITETMSTYYTGMYLDLTNSQIAIMSDYYPNVNKTQYSGTKIASVTVYTESAGSLYIGTASVADVIDAKKNGLSSITSNTTCYSVAVGKNEIIINLTVGENETIVFGGNNSVGLYYAQGIPVTETLGAFAYINGESNADIIQTTNNYNDTLAIEINVSAWSEKANVAYDESLKSAVVGQKNAFNVIKGGSESYGMVMAEGKNISNGEMPGYSGKTITKLGFIFANKLSDVSSGSTVTTDVTDTDAWVYAYVINKSIFTSNAKASENYVSMYKLTFANFTANASTQNHGSVYIGGDLVAIGENPWSYTTKIEVWDSATSTYSTISGIEIGSEELIAFAVGNCNFMLVTNYSSSSNIYNSSYTEYGDKFNYWYYESNGYNKSNQCAFPCDMYYSEEGASVSYKEKIASLEAEESEAVESNKANQVKSAHTNGLTISFLGDSLTAYHGWSDSSTYNSTLDGYTDNDGATVSANWNSYGVNTFGGITSENQTWWKQAADETGMTVLVNNSSSGSMATNTSSQDGGTAKSGINRSTQLHNDTGEINVNPDIIAVYMGINDLLAYDTTTNVSVDEFKTAYTTIIENIQSTYENAEIFVFTLPYIKLMNGTTTDFVDITRLTAFNEAIREVGNAKGCTVVEVYPNYSWTADNWTEYCITDVNGGMGHPNAKGMDLITNAFIDAMYDKYVTNATTTTGEEGN